MEIKIEGAAGGEVTGSTYLVRTKRATVLVDVGMFQGSKDTEEKNRRPIVPADKLDAILLTHAHLDHTGRVPILLKEGYLGPIFATKSTFELAEIILKDSAKIQMQDFERNLENSDEEPLYTLEDVRNFRTQGKSVALKEPILVAEGITARFFEAGHMLGSTSIELTIEEDGQKTVVIFSGDLGPLTQPIIKPFETPPYADIVFLESTYGDRDHRPFNETVLEFERIIKEAVATNGKILIPSFAIGRTQEIIYLLAVLFMEKKIKPFPIYIDSPMAIAASQVFALHPDLFDEETVDWIKKGLLPLDKNYFRPTETAIESKELNAKNGPLVIIAGAGMCNAGRILHHLKFNLPSANTHVVIVGYQGHGSLGRLLVDGAKKVKIHGQQVKVLAKIHTLNGFSAHAGQTDLLQWFEPLSHFKPKVLLTHGENGPREALAKKIKDRFGLEPLLPELDQVILI